MTEELIEQLKKNNDTLSFDEKCERMKIIYKSNMKEMIEEMSNYDEKFIIEFLIKDDAVKSLCKLANQDYLVYKSIKMWEMLEVNVYKIK